MEIDLEKIFLSKNDKNLNSEEQKYFNIFSILKAKKPAKKTLSNDKKLKLKKSLLERYDFYYQNKKSLKNIILSIFWSLAFLVFVIVWFNNYYLENLETKTINKNYSKETINLSNDNSKSFDSSTFGISKTNTSKLESYENNDYRTYLIILIFIFLSLGWVFIYKKKK